MDQNVLDDTLVNEGNITYAGFWIRVGATFIDGLILLPIYGLLIYNIYNIKSLAFLVGLSVLGVIYKPLLEFKRQATFGKQALDIKVIGNDLKRITLSQTLLRNSPWIIGAILTFISNLYLFSHEDFYTTRGMLEIAGLTQGTAINTISQLFNLVILISVLKVGFDSLKQGLHDNLADTYCIRTK